MSTVTVLGIETAAERFGEVVGEAVNRGAMKGLYSAAIRIVAIIQTQLIPAATPQPVDRAIYKAGWKAEPTEDGSMYFNTAPYAGVIEFGARAANIKVGRVMLRNLEEWVLRKGIAGGPKEAKRLAWAIAVSMAQTVTIKGSVRPGGGRGIFKQHGHRIMEKSHELLPTIIEEEVAREVERELSK